jgi:flagellar operon protein
VVQQVNFNDSSFKPIDTAQNQAQIQILQQQANKAAESVQSFNDVLQTTVNQGTALKFSAHAKDRLSLRNINLSADDVSRMTDAVNKAASKGAKQSLLVMNNLAFIVSVTNRTVITALDDSNMKENVFTNIDSAVIV